MRAIPCPISSDDLRRLHHDERLTDQQIVERIGSGATLKRVRSWRHRFGIETLLRIERNVVPPIEGQLRSLLVGSMLGDGRLARTPNGARYHENHSNDQRAYLEWKVAQWGSWAEAEIAPVVWKREGHEFPGWRFHTVAHPTLIEWHDRFYDGVKGSKRLSREVLDHVDAFALAVWFMDDGSTGWWPRITFGMDLTSQAMALAIFERFDLHPRWEVHKGLTGDFLFDGEAQAHRFIALVQPHIPPCMSRKLVFGFQGPHYQVRQALTPDLLREMAERGVPIRQMARELGQSAVTVSRYLDQFHIEHPNRGEPGRPRRS